MSAPIKKGTRAKASSLRVPQRGVTVEDIECCLFDMRPEVKLPKPRIEEVGRTAVVFVCPRCTSCRVADAAYDGAHSDPAYVTCGAPECRAAAHRRRQIENPSMKGDGVLITKGSRRKT